MNTRYFFTSLTRISNLNRRPFTVRPCLRAEWSMGDYIVGEVNPDPSRLPIELYNGRMINVAEGDLVIGARGTRHATLEATGDWTEIGPDGEMHALTGAGLMGKVSSRSSLLPPLLSLTYRGHVQLDDLRTNMQDFAGPESEHAFSLPVVLIYGTSMSSGKTTVGRIIIRQLKKLGLRVVGVKLTGAGRYRDILSLHDAGADHIFDFVDVGLPSTICPPGVFREVAQRLLGRIAQETADVAVIEVGASPLEPYNGEIAIDLLRPHIRCKVLCSSDPYAVVGVTTAFHLKPDFVAGVTTSTRAGIELVEKLAGVPALNVLNKKSHGPLIEILQEKLFTRTEQGRD